MEMIAESFLKKYKLLEELAPDDNVKIHKFIDSFNRFNNVVTSWYSKVLQPEYKNKINYIKSCFRTLWIRITLKVHAVFSIL